MKDLTNLISSYLNYVKELEEKSIEYEYAECPSEYFDISLFFDVPDIKMLYRPNISYTHKGKCNKCDKNRMILKESAVYNEYTVCSCFTDSIYVSVHSCPVIAFKNGYYILSDGSAVCADSVIHDANTTDFIGYNVFFDNENACECYCNRF